MGRVVIPHKFRRRLKIAIMLRREGYTTAAPSAIQYLERGDVVTLHDLYTNEIIRVRIKKCWENRFFGIIEGTDEGITFRKDHIRGIYWD